MTYQNSTISYIVVLLFVFTGCGTEPEKNNDTDKAHHFSLEQALSSDSANIDINRFLKLKRAFILEFQEDNPIQNIYKIILNGSKLFILDKAQNHIYVYDLQGNYLAKIGEIGDGPGEYFDITDFTIDNDELIIYSNNSRKIIHYGKTGELVKEVPVLFS